MRTTAKKFFVLCSVVMMLALVVSIGAVPASAASNGIYIASANPSYRNPTTGQIEDSGGDSSEVLGQSMTESATHRKALVEVDPSGNTYVTVRLKLQNSVSGVSFAVDGASVSASCMQEGNDTADYRMRVGSEHSVIRVKMFVTPMGRDVTFFITLSGLQEGSGDFITSVEVVKPTEAPETEPPATEPPATEAPATQPKPTSSKPAESAKPKEPAKEPAKEPVSTEAPEEETTAATEETVEVTEDTAPTESTGALGLQEFDASGDAVKTTEEAETQQQGGKVSVFLWVILGIAVVGGAGFCVWYFVFFKKKK